MIDSGDTAWVLTSSALVFIMVPGLAFFYAGLVRGKNALSTLLQSFIALAIVGLTWILFGYSPLFWPRRGRLWLYRQPGMGGGFTVYPPLRQARTPRRFRTRPSWCSRLSSPSSHRR